MVKKKCEKCGELIDRGACGQAFTIITVKDDRANKQEFYHQKRMYLCDGCTASLTLWLLGEIK